MLGWLWAGKQRMEMQAWLVAVHFDVQGFAGAFVKAGGSPRG